MALPQLANQLQTDLLPKTLRGSLDRVTDSPRAGATPQDNLGPRHYNARLCGANGEARTLDLLFTKQLLYQLSYIGTMRRIVAERAEAVKSSPVCYNFCLYHAAGQLPPLGDYLC